MDSDIWRVLGIEPTADKREIRRAYAGLVREYHVEDHPEEFAGIQKAYQEALEYAAGRRGEVLADSTGSMERENGFPADHRQAGAALTGEVETAGSGSILSRMAELREGEGSAYTKEEVISRILELLMDAGRAGDAGSWQEFFLSDGFLSVHGEEDFVADLIFAIVQSESRSGLVPGRLEPVFLKELALVYGITMPGYSNYQCNENQSQIAWLLGAQEGQVSFVTMGDDRQVDRSYSYYYLRRLCQAAEEGSLREYHQKEWGNLCFYAEDEYVGDTPVKEVPAWKDQLELMLEPHAPTCVAMHRYLVRHYSIPEHVCSRMRDNFEISGRMGGYPLCSYEPAYEQMCLRYPRMKDSAAVSLTDWKRDLLQVPPVFVKRELDLELMEWLMQFFRVRDCPEGLIRQVYGAYEEDGAALPLLEALIGRLSEKENLPDRLPKPGAYEGEMEISLKNRHFWSYFFSAAWPFSEIGEGRPGGTRLEPLSGYLKRVYPPSHRWNEMFWGREREICLEGRKIRLVFARHHLEYRLDGEPVFYQTLPFSWLASLSETEEEVISFFLLLPIAETASVSGVREEIRKRMKYLPFYRPTREKLAACLGNNRDWELRPDHPRKLLEEVYYGENEWHCFKGSLTGRKFTVEYRTPEGWHAMKLLNGESKAIRAIEEREERLAYMHQVVDSFVPPAVQVDGVIQVGEKTAMEKAEAIFDALTHRDSFNKNTSWSEKSAAQVMPKTREFIRERNLVAMEAKDNVILWFGREGEGSLSAIFYIDAVYWWDPKRTLYEVQGEAKNAYIKREERMKRRVGEPVDAIGWLRMEGLVPYPVGIGGSGTFYSFYSHQLVSAASFPELITRCLDLEKLDRIEIVNGKHIIGRYGRKLECWYRTSYNRETKDMDQNYPFERLQELFEDL